MPKNIFHWILVILGCVLFSTVQTTLTFEQSVNHPWKYLNDDQIRLGAWYHKLQDPTLYLTDYYHNDPKFIETYTPSLFTIVDALSPDGIRYEQALAYSQFPFLFLYLLATIVLFYMICRSLMLSFIFTLLSTTAFSVFGILEHWNVVGLIVMMSRFYAFPLITATIALWLWNLRYRTPRITIWLLIGGLIGISANLHPPTGITLGLVIGLASLVWWYRVRDFPLWHLVGLTAMTIIVSLPVALTAVSGIAPVADNGASVTFQSLKDSWTGLGITNLYSRNFLSTRGIKLDGDIQLVICWVWLVLSVITWKLAKTNSRSFFYLWFVVLQTFLIWTLTDIATPLILALLGYLVWRWQKYDDESYLFDYELVASIGVISLIVPIIVYMIWSTFEVWSLTIFLYQFSRAAKLLTIPIFLLSLRAMMQLIRSEGTIWSVRYLLMGIAILSLFIEWYFVIPAVAIMIIYDSYPMLVERNLFTKLASVFVIAMLSMLVIIRVTFAIYLPVNMGVSLLFATVMTLAWWVSRSNKNQYNFLAIAVVVASLMILIGLMIYPNTITDNNRNFMEQVFYPSFATIVLGLLLGFSFSLTRLKLYQSEQTLIIIAIVCILLIQNIGQTFLIDMPVTEIDPQIEIALWAHEHLPQNTLVFPALTFNKVDRVPLEFRYWSGLGITHSKRDLTMIAHSYVKEYAYYSDRYNEIVASYSDPLKMIEVARNLNADYILSRNDQFSLDLPIVYQNDVFALYDISGD